MVNTNDPHIQFRHREIADRQVDTLIGICKGLIADEVINYKEATFLQHWLAANEIAIKTNPVVYPLFCRVNEMLGDSVLDNEEAEELLATLHSFTNNEGLTEGELLRTTGLPLDTTQPMVVFPKRKFVFTGTFAYGKRDDCRRALEQRGGVFSTGITRKLDYLVLGSYVTPSWKHENFGRKIEQAMDYRERGHPLAIISEEHWRLQGRIGL